MAKPTADTQLAGLYTQPGHLLRRAQQISASMFRDELGPAVTPIQYAILSILLEHPGVDQVTMAGLVAIDTSTAASVAIRLEEKKLLTRGLDPSDRRQRVLYLTEAGKAVLLQSNAAIMRLSARIFEGFSAEEERQFMQLLEKLVHLNNSQSRAPLAQRLSEANNRAAQKNAV